MTSVCSLTHCFHWTIKPSFIFIVLTIIATPVAPEQVRVMQRQGSIHAFLVVKDENGKEIAVGDETSGVRGNVVGSRTIFRFRDGSVDDEETVYRQGPMFELIRDHRIQKGPSYSKPSDVTIDLAKGEVTWVDESNNESQAKSQHMNLPRDLANGLVPLLVENLPKGSTELKVSYLAVDSKPRIVSLDIKPDGSDKVDIGVDGRRADRFNIHTDIQGIAGVVAPIVGKQPPDIKLWVTGGAVPVFVRMDGPFYEQGPRWTVLLAAPSWPAEETEK
jgi:hypothetical protein